MNDAILDVAERLVQTRGYNGFSYRDVAEELGIKSSSIHYHFPTKSDLGVGLVARYRTRFRAELRAISARWNDPGAQLVAFCDLFHQKTRVEKNQKNQLLLPAVQKRAFPAQSGAPNACHSPRCSPASRLRYAAARP